MTIQTIHEGRVIGDAELERKFGLLAEAWREGRGVTSSMTKIVMHPAYLQIIGMGPVALPMILRELQRNPDFWFLALQSITGENPVPREHAGNLKEMTQDWLNWAKLKGQIR